MPRKKKPLSYRPLKLTKKRKVSPVARRFKPGVMTLHGTGIKVGTSQAENNWLDKLGVVKRQVVFRGFNNKVYVIDGVDPTNKIAYEFLGCNWHGHYTHLNLKNINSLTKKTNGQMYCETKARFQYLYDLGWKVFFVWECDWRKGLVGRYYTGPKDIL